MNRSMKFGESINRPLYLAAIIFVNLFVSCKGPSQASSIKENIKSYPPYYEQGRIKYPILAMKVDEEYSQLSKDQKKKMVQQRAEQYCRFTTPQYPRLLKCRAVRAKKNFTVKMATIFAQAPPDYSSRPEGATTMPQLINIGTKRVGLGAGTFTKVYPSSGVEINYPIKEYGDIYDQIFSSIECGLAAESMRQGVAVACGPI